MGAQVGTSAVTGDGIGGGWSDDEGDSGTESISSGTSNAILQQLCGDLIPQSQSHPLQHYYVGTPPHNGAETDSDGTTSEHSLQAAATTNDPDQHQIR